MTNDLLLYVRNCLEARKGDLRRVANESGISYDTVHRIKNGEGDPGYSKVQKLAEYFDRGCSQCGRSIDGGAR